VTVEIRRLRPGEERQAGDVTALAYRNQAEPASSNPDYLDRVADVAARAQHAMILVAVEEGRLLGTVTVELTGRIPGGHPRPPLEPDRAHVRMLGVHPDVQGRGIGRRLMEGAAEEARRAGKRRVTLETTETMRAAQHLYESMGYRRGEDLEFDDGFRLRTYVLRL
jgi:ribosomal protein S18 acetylase RimI-like enzyme